MTRFLAAFLFLLTLCTSALYAQEKKKIEILGADVLTLGKVGEEKVRKLIGNVKMKQDDVYMDCDSAYFYVDRNAVDAFSNVYIHQEELNIYADSLKYDGDTRIADLYGNVRLTDPRMKLTTKRLTYNLATKTAVYRDGGHIISDGTDLVSRIGYYYSESKMAFFRYDVKLVNPNYTLECDTLGYNMDSEISYFYGPTYITTDKSKIYCETGWYNGKTEVSSFGKNTILDNPPQILYTDSLYYEKKVGYGEAYYKFTWVDTSENIILSGGKAIFFELNDSITATEKPLLTYLMDGDSLHIASDTLISRKSLPVASKPDTLATAAVDTLNAAVKDSALISLTVVDTLLGTIKDTTALSEQPVLDTLTTDKVLAKDKVDTTGHRELYAFHNVRMYKSDMQGACDSLVYTFKDSTIRMYRQPILWGDDSQMTGDTIYLYMADNQMDRVELFPNGFIINESFPKLYDQIKGRFITGYFKDGDLDNMHVVGNGESVYYGKDSRSAYLGINKAVCSEMWIYLNESKVSRIKFYTKPTATFHPIQLVNPESFKLENFNWRYDKRPKNKEDLLKDPEPEAELDSNATPSSNAVKKGTKLGTGGPIEPTTTEEAPGLQVEDSIPATPIEPNTPEEAPALPVEDSIPVPPALPTERDTLPKPSPKIKVKTKKP